jgi:hypothetical protein
MRLQVRKAVPLVLAHLAHRHFKRQQAVLAHQIGAAEPAHSDHLAHRQPLLHLLVHFIVYILSIIIFSKGSSAFGASPFGGAGAFGAKPTFGSASPFASGTATQSAFGANQFGGDVGTQQQSITSPTAGIGGGSTFGGGFGGGTAAGTGFSA